MERSGISTGDGLARDARLQMQIEILLDQERHRVHDWYGSRLHALKEWARKQPQEIFFDIFSCLANGFPNWDEKVNFAAQLQQLKFALKESELEVLSLREKVVQLESR